MHFSFSLLLISLLCLPTQNLFSMNALALPKLFVQETFSYLLDDYAQPWNGFKQLKTLQKVCTQWSSITPSDEKLRKHLDIPQLHYYAMKNNYRKVVSLVLSNNRSLLELDNRGYSCAYYAAAISSLDALKVLHIGHAVIPFKGKLSYHQKIRPFLTSIKKGKWYVAGQLTDALERKNYKKIITIMSSCMRNWLPEAHTYYNKTLDKHLDPLGKPKTTFLEKLLLYTLRTHLENEIFTRAQNAQPAPPLLIEYCISYTPNLNSKNISGRTVLVELMHKENPGQLLTQILTVPSVNIDLKSHPYGYTATHFAAALNKFADLKKLINTRRCNVNILNDNGETPLVLAVMMGAAECIQLLLQSGADQDFLFKEGESLLHYAVLADKSRSLQALLMYSTLSVNSKDKKGNTPLSLAAKLNRFTCAQLLLEQNTININEQNNVGETALHWGASKNSISIIKMLVEKGAHINAPCSSNRKIRSSYTPLHFAAKNGHVLASNLLLLYGADPSIKTKNGETSFDLAQKNGHTNLAKLFLS